MSYQFPCVIHAIHTNNDKPDGAWDMLHGLLDTRCCNEAVARTIVVGTLAGPDHLEMDRLLGMQDDTQRKERVRLCHPK